MTVFVLTHKQKGVHTYTGVLCSSCKEKPEGITGRPPSEPMVQSFYSNTAVCGGNYIKSGLFSIFSLLNGFFPDSYFYSV